MKKSLSARRVFLAALAGALVVGVFALTGCACSDQSAQKESSSSVVAEETMYTVPNVVSLTQADAKKAINASGLQVGKVTKEASETVPLGCVISQDPEGFSKAKPNSKVNLVVSTGKAEAADVVVPDLKGKSQDDAEKALSDVGLVGVASNPEETDEVDPGLVFKQSVEAGTTVKEGTKVAFTVAVAPSQATVPGVIGMTKDDARNAIVNAKLGFDSTTAYSDSVAEGVVISQSVVAGTQVKQGTTVSITVSLGAKPQEDVTVPDVSTYSWSDAEYALHSAGLAARYTGDAGGVVVSQDVAAGTKVAPNTLVTVTLATPVEYVDVPDLYGMSVTAAESATDKLGLGLDASSWDGTVIDQWPAAGTSVEVGTTVSVTVKSHEEEIAEAFMGSWQAGRASLEIQNVGGGFVATINWASSATESTSWEYVCEIEGDQMVCSGNGTKTEVDTDDDGNEVVVYTDGSATFSINKHGQLTWKDHKENAGKGLKFDKIS